jgi:hypothetical protein
MFAVLQCFRYAQSSINANVCAYWRYVCRCMHGSRQLVGFSHSEVAAMVHLGHPRQPAGAGRGPRPEHAACQL